MICIDNYRVFAAATATSIQNAKLHSIWAWTRSAITIPDGPLNVTRRPSPERRPHRPLISVRIGR